MNDTPIPAIRRRPSSRPTLLVFEILAVITKAEIEDMARQVAQAFDQYGLIDMLLVMVQFDGMELGAVFDKESLETQARSIRHVRKYGVVGAPAWARVMIEISDHLSPVDSKTFSLADEPEAWAWIEAK
jgi:hypothetical protein